MLWNLKFEVWSLKFDLNLIIDLMMKFSHHLNQLAIFVKVKALIKCLRKKYFY